MKIYKRLNGLIVVDLGETYLITFLTPEGRLAELNVAMEQPKRVCPEDIEVELDSSQVLNLLHALDKKISWYSGKRAANMGIGPLHGAAQRFKKLSLEIKKRYGLL